jgi:hypothetical protein
LEHTFLEHNFKESSKFTFSTSSSMKDIGVDVASDEWL